MAETPRLSIVLCCLDALSAAAADHIEVLTATAAQVPRARRKRLLVRVDGAGASYALLD